MIIEFREGCSLEIAHIGTREEIEMEILIECAQRATDSLADIGRVVYTVFSDAFIALGKALCEIGENMKAMI
ncbi:hypothetical protein M0R72_19850 [Candidatus Pacearchaeota archaeon]|jgi:hypothetical protein|nr:hypothetical protein [Candidatus Pacearchaeota archaeon]